jgi:hypothetical protein
VSNIQSCFCHGVEKHERVLSRRRKYDRAFVEQGLALCRHAECGKTLRFTERNCPPHFVPKRSCCEPHAFYRSKSRRALFRLKFYAEMHKVAKPVFYRATLSSTFRPQAVMLRNLCVFSSQIVACFCSKGCRHAECCNTYRVYRAKSCSTLCPKAVMLRNPCVFSSQIAACFCSKCLSCMQTCTKLQNLCFSRRNFPPHFVPER